MVVPEDTQRMLVQKLESVSSCRLAVIGHRKTILVFSERARRGDFKKPKIFFLSISSPEILATELVLFYLFFTWVSKKEAGAK
jgi:hypothetical protein